MLYLKSLIAGLLAPVSGAKVEFQGVTAGAKIPTPMTSFSNPVPSKSEMFYFQEMIIYSNFEEKQDILIRQFLFKNSHKK